MKTPIALAVIAAAAAAGAAFAAPAVPAPAASSVTQAAPSNGDWAGVRFDDDDDDRRRYGPMPRPNREALRAAGMTRIDEVERDDGRLEVEGWDAEGREIEVHMDLRGQRVLHVDRDDDRRGDRWDD